MNQFFGNNGFDIIDLGSKYIVGDNFKTERKSISNEKVTFENDWGGLYDEDIYKRALKESYQDNRSKTAFFHFIMTTSNHSPFTYPNEKNRHPLRIRKSREP